ncbi:unnamed protein product, partial [Mesorhabditis spiculigera]
MRCLICMFLLWRAVEGVNMMYGDRIPLIDPHDRIELRPDPSAIRIPRSPGVWDTVSNWFSTAKTSIFGGDEKSGTTPTGAPVIIPTNRPTPVVPDANTVVLEGSGMTPSASGLTLRDFIQPKAPVDGNFMNGLISARLYRALGTRSLGDEVMPMNHPLKHDDGMKTEFVTFWYPTNGRPVWGKATMDPSGNVVGSYIFNNQIFNTTDQQVLAKSRVLTYTPADEEAHNFRYGWVPVGRLDRTTAVTITGYDTNQCTQYVPAIYIDSQHSNYEFLGEADLVNRIFYYVNQGIVNSVSMPKYQTDVRVMVKLRCRCSCDSPYG